MLDEMELNSLFCDASQQIKSGESKSYTEATGTSCTYAKQSVTSFHVCI